MRVKNFLKENNISLDRMMKILSYRTWDYEDFNLNSMLKIKDITYLIEKLNLENYDKIHEEINKKREKLKLESSKNLKLEESSYEFSDEEIDYEIALEEYYDLVKFLVMNFHLNNEKTKKFISEYTNKFEKKDIYNNNEKLFYILLDLREELNKNSEFLKSSILFDDILNVNMEIYGFFQITKRLFEKNKNPFFSANIILRYRKIYSTFIESYRYENFITYKKIIDFKNGKIFDEDKEYPTSSSSSVYSSPHPFRN